MTTGTLCDLFYRSVDTYRKPEHLKAKVNGQWTPWSSDALRTAVEELALGLASLGVEKGDRVAILSENRPEWVIADLASLCIGAVDVPIYATLTAAQVKFILEDSQAKVAIASNVLQARKLAEVRGQLPQLRHLVRMGEGNDFPEGFLSFEEVRARGRAALTADPQSVRRRAAEVKPDDLATLIYTSGTTGDPKGVMLMHSNIVSNVEAARQVFDVFKADDVALSFLPLCHVFERMAGYYMMLAMGSTIAYAESVDAVPANMLEVRPTVMCSVPRLYEKMYARVLEKVAGDPPQRQKIFRWARSIGRRLFQHQVEHTTPPLGLRLKGLLADKLVFSKIRARTGGRLKYFVSGGAPLSREINEFFGSVGLQVREGYGLTETSPVITVNQPDRFKPGTVGLPLPGVEVKIADDGEILTRGPHVMKGYFGKPQATADAIDPEGWFHTGDIGIVDADGFLTITDRKKDLIVTSGGKNIAPQPIENVLKTNPLFAEVVMIGDRRNFPSALVVPNFDALEKWAREKGLAFSSREDLVQRPEVLALYEQTIRDLTPHLAQFERIKKVALLTQEFTLEAGELTPTLKVKRRVIEQKYKDVIDKIYEAA